MSVEDVYARIVGDGNKCFLPNQLLEKRRVIKLDSENDESLERVCKKTSSYL